MGEVAGQDENRFREGDQEHRDHTKRQQPNELTHNTWDKKQRRKGDHGGQNRCGDGRNHLGRAVNCCLDVALAHLSVHVNVFTNDDAVIDEHAQSHQKGKHGHHVERLVAPLHDDRGAQHRNRDAQGDPKSQMNLQEDGEEYEDDDESLQPVAGQQIEAIPHIGRKIVPGHQFISRR